ncbi:MAG: DUF2007 domain-containing protein [Flavobacteriales bacterium]|nr:DUF2007 domain-containing protein [Flavobacteriales bacterium]MEB2341703.1 DUF2007 domain-containing protein [Flavobacteriia bacterium]
MPFDHDLVPIRFYDDPLEAHLARCLLENEGIAAFVHDENIVGLNRMLSYAVGGVKLKVKQVDKMEALRILDLTEQRPYMDDQGRPMACPNCGSAQLSNDFQQPRTVGGILHLAIATLFMVYPLAIDRSMRCLQCGHVFRPHPGATAGNDGGRSLAGDRPSI